MFTTHLKLAFRTLRKQRGFSFINIAGLAIGIASCLMMLLYVSNELSYDHFHEKADRIVRVVVKGNFQGEPLKEPMAMPPVAAALQENFPEIEEATRLRNQGKQTIVVSEQVFHDQTTAYVDPSFFSVFSFPFLQGDPTTALEEASSVVISSSVAQRYFGQQNPLGKTIRLKNQQADFMVTGVMEDMPDNSHLQKEILLSMTGWEEARSPSYLQSEYYTYLVLPQGYNYLDLEAKLPSVFNQKLEPQLQKAMGMSFDEFRSKGNDLGLFLQPLTDIYLHSDFAFDIASHGDIRYVYIFSAIAMFMLLIACINFMNLSTAGAAKRAKEVGVRKVLGSQPSDLVAQFLTESNVLTFLSLIIAVVLVQVTLPFFNQLIDRDLSFGWLQNWWLAPMLVLFGGVVGLLAGSYPAFFLAQFRPKTALNQGSSPTSHGVSLRRGLVFFQFVLTIPLLIGTAIVFQQMRFIQNAKLGYDTESVLVVKQPWRLHEKE
ncbi:MAG: ABC transporter permease, partial [Saprospiraceae bacterium]